MDLLECPGMRKEGGELQIGVKLVPGEEGLTVRIFNLKSTNGGGEDERVQSHGTDGNRAIQSLRELLDRDPAHDRGKDEKAHDGVSNQQTEQPSDFASSPWWKLLEG